MATVTNSKVTNTTPSPGILLNDSFPDILNTNFDAIKKREWGQEVQGLRHFKEESTNREYVKESSVTGVGLMELNSDESDLPIDHTYQGYDHTITPKDFRLSIRITRKLRETDQFSVIGKMQNALARSPRDTTEYWAADAFNSGFGTNAMFLCGDGMYLFDSGRPYEDPALGNWSNLETAAALTSDSLETMRQNFRKIKDERGLLRPQTMAKLTVPTDLERKATELVQSNLRPETALNDMAFHQGKFQVDVWDYLTSTTAWFGCIDMSSDLFELCWYWRVRPSSSSFMAANNDDVFVQKVRMSFFYGCLRAQGLRGNAGA